MKKNGGDDFATECHVQCDYVSNRGYIRVAHNVHRRITMHTHTMRAYCVSSPIEESPVSGASYACILCGYTLLLFGGGRWNARGMLLKSIEAHSSSSFLIIPLYIGLIAQTFAPSLSPRFGRLGFFSRTRLCSNPLTEEKENVVVRITDKKNRTEKKWRGRERTKRERFGLFCRADSHPRIGAGSRASPCSRLDPRDFPRRAKPVHSLPSGLGAVQEE